MAQLTLSFCQTRASLCELDRIAPELVQPFPNSAQFGQQRPNRARCQILLGFVRHCTTSGACCPNWAKIKRQTHVEPVGQSSIPFRGPYCSKICYPAHSRVLFFWNLGRSLPTSSAAAAVCSARAVFAAAGPMLVACMRARRSSARTACQLPAMGGRAPGSPAATDWMALRLSCGAVGGGLRRWRQRSPHATAWATSRRAPSGVGRWRRCRGRGCRMRANGPRSGRYATALSARARARHQRERARAPWALHMSVVIRLRNLGPDQQIGARRHIGSSKVRIDGARACARVALGRARLCVVAAGGVVVSLEPGGLRMWPVSYRCGSIVAHCRAPTHVRHTMPQILTLAQKASLVGFVQSAGRPHVCV